MGTSDYEQRRQAAAQQAAEYLLQSEHMTNAERSEFVAWLRESPLHVAEMLRVARVHAALTNFQRWNDVTPSDTAEPNVVHIAPPRDVVAHAVRPRHRWRWTFALAAAATIVVAFGIFLVSYSTPIFIRTELGERRELTLADGSAVSVAPDSELRIVLTLKERRIELDRGDAFFHVAKNPSRPFIVYTPRAQIRAVGTAFGVQNREGEVVVSVVEGRVAVTGSTPAVTRGRDEGAAPTAVAVGANEQLSVSASSGAGPVRHIDGSSTVAWASGQFVFDDETVTSIVQRFNRYNRVKIIIDDPDLAQRRVSGVFRVTQPESFVAILSSMSGASAVRQGDRLVLRSSGSDSPDAPDVN